MAQSYLKPNADKPRKIGIYSTLPNFTKSVDVNSIPVRVTRFKAVKQRNYAV